MSTRYLEKCVYIPENAINPARFQQRRTRTVERPLRAVFLGRLVPYKGADMLLEAAAPLIRSGDLHVKIIGDGPQMGTLKEIVGREQISEGVELAGWVDHTRVSEHLIDADVFVFPSIREFGGAVALEAMAVGLVPMVTRYGGLAELVTEQTGFLIEMADRATIVSKLRENLQHVVAHPEEIEQKSQRAYDRAMSQFTWDYKARQTIEVYKWVLGQSTVKPFWGMPLGEEPDPRLAD